MNEIFVISLIIISNFICFRIYSQNKLNPILAISIWFSIVIWYSIPGLIFLFFKEQLDGSSYYSLQGENAFIISYSIENAGIILVILILLLNKKRLKKEKNHNSLEQNIIFKNKIAILVTFLISGLYIFFRTMNSNDFSYSEQNSVDNYGSLSFLETTISFSNQMLAAYTVLIAIETNQKKIYYFSLLLLFLNSMTLFLSGGRFVILIVLVVPLFRAYNIKNYFVKKPKINFRAIYLICFLLISAKFVMPLFIHIGDVRLSDKVESRDLINGNSYENNSTNRIANELFAKLDFFSAGYALVKNDGSGVAGITPYLGSIFIFIPRSILKERPISGTKDGTIETHPSRLVPKTFGVYSDTLNVGVSPVQIAIWQWGNTGFLIFVLACCLYLKSLNSLIQSHKIPLKVLGIYSLSIPMFNEIFPSPDVVIKKLVMNTFCVLFIFIFLRTKKLFAYH